MSISINNLTKIYGTQRAIDSISFEVNRGEILGFLGPNGAGKSTTMKIITGYLPPSSGDAVVNGINVLENSSEVKKITGYLPEHNPLYLDMYVHEFLEFSGRLYKFTGKVLKSKVNEIIELCGLEEEQNKLVGSLSKGYRQRVGLAHSLIHDPQVLVLDEPTTGLDPNQIIEIRKVIKNVSKEKTVIFSTHILQEVKALCERVVIINKGRIVADDRVESLTAAKNNQRKIEIEVTGTFDFQELLKIENVEKIEFTGKNKYEILISGTEDIRPLVSRKVIELGADLVGIKVFEISIESVFQELTREDDVADLS